MAGEGLTKEEARYYDELHLRKKMDSDYLAGQAQLRGQKAPGLVEQALADEQQADAIRAFQSAGQGNRTAELNQAVLAKIQQEGVGPMEAGPMEPVQVQQPIQAEQTPQQFSKDYLNRVSKRKSLLQGIANLFGITDRSDAYEKNALAKYSEYMTQQAMQGLVGKEFENNLSLFNAATKLGMPLDSIKTVMGLGLVGEVEDPDKKIKQYTFTSPDGKEVRSGFIVEEEGETPQRFFYGEQGTAPSVPHDWTGKSGTAATQSVTIEGAKKPDLAIKETMIKRAAEMINEAKSFWLDDDGNLDPDLEFWDALAWRGPARTTRLKMERALSIALRLESGAAIGEDERAQFYDLFMPNQWDWMTGDKEAAIQQKFEDFEHYINMIAEMIDPSWSKEDKLAIFRDVAAEAQEGRSGNLFDQIEGS